MNRSILNILTIFLSALAMISCQKEDISNLSASELRAGPAAPDSRTFDLSNCPNDDDECCQAPKGDCNNVTTVVTPGKVADLDNLVANSDGSPSSTDNIYNYFESNQDEFSIPTEFITALAAESVLTIEVHVSGSKRYYIVKNSSGEIVYVQPVQV